MTLGRYYSSCINVGNNRNVEPELFPCLRKFDISFYEFNPRMSETTLASFIYRSQDIFTVGGGFFTGRYAGMTEEVEAGTRFDPTKGQGQVCFLDLVHFIL